MIKPQLLTGLIGLTLICLVAMYLGQTEVATACPAGIVALGLKLLEVKKEE